MLNREKELLKISKKPIVKNNFKTLLNNIANLDENVGKYLNLCKKITKSEKLLKKKFI
jgi:hypothetical protein